LSVVAAAVVAGQRIFMPRLLLVTFDPESAQIAGVNTRRWALALNLSIGVVASAAVHEIGALSTFALLSLPPMAALLVMGSIRSVFGLAAALGILVPAIALALSFRFDLPAGPTCVALLAAIVRVRLSPAAGGESSLERRLNRIMSTPGTSLAPAK
jgi:ABC-type Mn2+/Zn2+ transport system permease subunit